MDRNYIGKYNFNITMPSVFKTCRKYKVSVDLNSDIQDTATFNCKTLKREKIKLMRAEAAGAFILAGENEQAACKKANKLSEETLEFAQKLISAGGKPYFVYSDISKFSKTRLERCLFLIDNGFDYTNALIASKGKFNFDEIFLETKDGYVYLAQEDDNQSMKISASKSFYNPESGIVSVIEKTYRENGGKTVSRTEYEKPEITVNEKGEYQIEGKQTNCNVSSSGEEPKLGVKERAYWEINGEYTPCEVNTPTRTHYVGTGKTIETEYKNNKNNVKTQIEILPDNSGQPAEIIFTKQSDKLPGAFETLKYELTDYDEDIDVISEIKNGTLPGGEILSQVSENPDGSKTLKENFSRNGCGINREFYKNDSRYSYSYVITDENGKTIMNLNRSFEQNPNGSTTTKINGKEYISNFDDETKSISIKDDEGTITTVNLKEVIQDDDSDEFWNFLKTLPADNLIAVNNHIQMIFPVDKNSSQISQGVLMSGKDSFIIKHELAHACDFQDDWNRRAGEISNDKKLNKIYNEEIKAFNRDYTEVTQDIIGYFLPGGGSSVTGLAETVAEVGALLGTYGSDTDSIIARGQYLVRYFPKTTARIAELTGYNDKDIRNIK